jgi:clan AA aspartic protease
MTPFANGTPILRSVGISYIQGTVRGPSGTEATVRFLIDSGAIYSLLPEPVWQAIGLAPQREMDFSLADGTTIRRPVSECRLSLPQGEGHTPVVLGQPGDAEALLGVVTLEILGLVFDPFRRTLHPMRALMV